MKFALTLLLVLPPVLGLGPSHRSAHPTLVLRQDAQAQAELVRQRLTEDVAWLAADERQGRRAGTPAEREAAEWLAARFQALGLEPAGEAGYLQAFDVPLDARDGGESSLRLLLDDASVGREFRGPMMLAPLTPAERGSVLGRLVFAGFGVVAPEREWDDYGEVNVEGAIVLVIDGEPSGGKAPPPPSESTSPHGPTVIAGAGWGESTSVFHKIMNARRRGALGVLIAPHPERLAKPIARFDPSREVRAGLPALAISLSVASSLVPDFAKRSHELALSDASHSPSQVELAEPRLVDLFCDVVRENGRAHNVLARLAGSGPGITVVGAHYDHLGLGGSGSLEPGSYGAIHNGADDNASGTAVVLEIARRLAATPTRQGEVLFALWSGEELGLLGSSHWMERPTRDLAAVRANINLDMVGRAGGGKLSVLGAGTSPVFASWMEAAGTRAELVLEVALGGAALGGSDHQSFLKRQIPALHLFSGLHGDYHKPSDDLERFEAEGARRVVELSLDLIERIQAEPALPYSAPVEAAASEGNRARGRWSVRFGTMPDYAFEGTGLKLSGTSPGSPAAEAGLLAGDILLQVGDVEIATIHDFMYALQTYKPGDVVLTRFLREGEEQRVRVTLAAVGQ